MSSRAVAIRVKPSFGFLIMIPLLLSLASPMVSASVSVEDEPQGYAPSDIWYDDYDNEIFPWAAADDRVLKFKE